MRLVVAGLGRTGTQSIVAALEHLDVRSCSQRDVLGDDELFWSLVHAVRGEAAFDAEPLADYDATVGWPLCFLYEAQLRHWPDAICLLNTRDADQWFDSVAAAWKVLNGVRRMKFLAKARMVDAMASMLESRMGGPIDRPRWTDAYRRHAEEVRATVDPARLVEFPLGAGWGPLCHALGVDEPQREFPRGNSSKGEDFRRNVMRILGGRG